MSLFVKVTDQCREDAKRHDYTEALSRLIAKLEKDQNIALFDAFPPPYLVRKKFGNNQGRLIAARRDVTVDGVDHTIVILLSILIRGDDAYDNLTRGFGHKPELYGRIHFEPMLVELEPTLQKFVRDRTRIDPPPEKPQISGNEWIFLKEKVDSGTANTDILVCETKNWIDGIQLVDNQLLTEIGECIAELCVNASGLTAGKGRKTLIRNAPLAISYSWDPNSQRLTLLRLQSDVQTPVSQAKDGNEPPPRNDNLKAFRSYPAWMSLEGGLFMDLERDTYGNMALSDEEQNVLHPLDGEMRFPLFINGRAGSGKSTILQYLFAEFFARFAQSERPFDNPPAYFACNEELVIKAQEFVASILRTNPAYAENPSVKRARGDLATYRRSFKVFREHLMSMLTQEERETRFPDDKYIDYGQFLRLWENGLGRDPNTRKECGADISWHVIRTFIKGTSVDGIMERDEYDLLPDNQKSVSSDLFGTVYTRVWEAWYKQLTENMENGGGGYWDDQDLVRHLLVSERFEKPQAKFPGIFCDEAQDFTQIEIVVFLKMSAFSDRKVFPHDISALPFVFAGDEFQTLNPTGFSWDAVKGTFHEKFIRGLCPAARTQLVDRDLKNNYRSVREIVRFSNSVQLLRAARFGKRQLEPQLEWNDEKGRPIAFYDREFDALWTRLKARNDVHIIVPCHANEELEYVRNDPKLKEVIKIDNATGTTSPCVLSPVKAKGLEYQCVVVYGFGACLPSDSLVRFDDGPKWNNDAERMAMEYFLNRLYVAVSRPRNQLYIVDSEEGIERLWKFAKNKEVLDRLSNGLPQDWDSRTDPWVPGNDQMLNPTYTVDYAMLAEQDERAAEAVHDAAQMFQAANWYKILGQSNKETECLGKAHMFRNEYNEAGSCFDRIGQYDRAGECYWKMKTSEGWRKMGELAAVQQDLARRPEYVVSKTLADNRTDVIPSTLQFIISAVETSGVGSFQTQEWRQAISSLATRALDMREEMLCDSFGKFIALGQHGFVEGLRPLAKKAFSYNRYKQSKTLFELSRDTNNPEYNKAKAFTETYPSNLLLLSKLGPSYDKQVLESFDSNGSIPLDSAQTTIVAGALLRAGRYWDFAKICSAIESEETFIALKSNKVDSSISAMIDHLALIEKFKNTKGVDLPQAIFSLVKSAGKVDKKFIVRLMARCFDSKSTPDFTTAPRNVQMAVYSFLDEFVDDWLKNDRSRITVSIEELGTALEFYGKKTSAVHFYGKAVQGQDNKYLRERLIAARRKRIQFNKNQMSEQKFREEVRNLASEAKALEVALAKVPDVPEPLDWDELKRSVIAAASPTTSSQIESPKAETVKQAALKEASDSETKAQEEPALRTNAASRNLESKESSGNGKSIPSCGTGTKSPRATSFVIDGKYRVEWVPKRGRATITIIDQNSEFNGDAWTFNKEGVSGDGDVNIPAKIGAAVHLPNTSLIVLFANLSFQPNEKKGEVVENVAILDETGVCHVFPLS